MMGSPDEIFATSDVVTFQLSDEVLAVPAAHLREVLELVPVTRVPGAPDFAAGVVNVRGGVVPLADLRVPLRMPRTPPGRDARILVLDLPCDGEATVVGILADSVHEVTRLDPHSFEQIPQVGTRWPPRYIAAIGRRSGEFVTLPNMSAIFADFLAELSNPSAIASSGSAASGPEHQQEVD